MTKREAMNQGLTYTGMSYRNWDQESKEHCKARAQELRKTYGIRLVLVGDEPGWVSYYADHNYFLVAHNNEDVIRNRVNSIEQQREKLYNEYMKKLEELNKGYEEDLEKLNKIESLKKGGRK